MHGLPTRKPYALTPNPKPVGVLDCMCTCAMQAPNAAWSLSLKASPHTSAGARHARPATYVIVSVE